jgi:hypothetical protein
MFNSDQRMHHRQHVWTCHAVSAVNNRYATMNFSVSYSFSSQNKHYTSLFFFPRLHYWCWTAICRANLTSSKINTRLVCKGTSLCFPESPPDVRTVKHTPVLPTWAPWELCVVTRFHFIAPHIWMGFGLVMKSALITLIYKLQQHFPSIRYNFTICYISSAWLPVIASSGVLLQISSLRTA